MRDIILRHWQAYPLFGKCIVVALILAAALVVLLVINEVRRATVQEDTDPWGKE